MANTEKRKPLPTIGVDKYTFFAVKTDTSEGATYGDPYNLRGTVEIAPTDAGGSDVFDADNGAYETSNYIEKLGHDITNADIPPEVDSMWRGLTQKDGVVEVDITRVHTALRQTSEVKQKRQAVRLKSKLQRLHTQPYNVILTTTITHTLTKAICRRALQRQNLRKTGLRI